MNRALLLCAAAVHFRYEGKEKPLQLIYINQQESGAYWGLNPETHATCPLKPGAFERLAANGALRLMQGQTRQYEGDVPSEDIDGGFGSFDVSLDDLLGLNQ